MEGEGLKMKNWILTFFISLIFLAHAYGVSTPINNPLFQGTAQSDLAMGSHNITTTGSLTVGSITLTTPLSPSAYPAFVGDSGAGGTRGAVPAPAAGDFAAGKLLSAGGGWVVGGTGTVTSVALTTPAWLTVTGSPITVSGTLAVTGTSQSANLFLASPNGGSGAMTPRAIVNADLPASGVTAQTYGDSTHVAQVAVNSKGIITSASNVGIAGASAPPYVKISDTTSAGVDPGTFTSGSWQTTPLTTKDFDTGSNCTLASNHFTLTSGTYYVNWFFIGYHVNAFQSRIRNTTDSTTVAAGSIQYSNGAEIDGAESIGSTVITTDGTKTYELQGQCEVTQTVDGYGFSRNFGENNIFSAVVMLKVQ
jgi:hypothetical protein